MNRKLTYSAFVGVIVFAFTMLVAGTGRPGLEPARAAAITATATPTATPTASATPTATPTANATPTATPTASPTATPTAAAPTTLPGPTWITTINSPADPDGLRPAVRLTPFLSSADAPASTRTVQNLVELPQTTTRGPSLVTMGGIGSLVLGSAVLVVLAATRLSSARR
jgi:hypothetical protein